MVNPGDLGDYPAQMLDNILNAGVIHPSHAATPTTSPA